MTTTLSERFAKSSGAPVQLDGVEIVNIYRREVAAGQELLVAFVHAVGEPVQGLRIKLNKGLLLVNGQLLKDVILWADTAPQRMRLRLQPKGAKAELRVWNCWRDGQGTTQAWVGNAGIVLNVHTDGATLRCSCGRGGTFSPNDLEVRLIIG